ncbi:MAG: DUF2905 domain-containing protein [Acidobacteriaceae bacterium]
MPTLGRLLIFAGILLIVVGAGVLAAHRFGIPLGRLPGDFAWRGKHSAVYFPLATSLLLSALLSLLLYALGRLRR